MNVILTMDNKGGIGKSLDAEMVSSALVGAGYQVARIDTDTSNSSFTTIYPDAKHVSVGEANVKAGGDLAAAILDAADSGADFLIGDTGARDEVRIVAHLAQILEATAQSGGRVIVLRPVNLNLAVHNNAVTFAERFAKDNSVSVLFAPSVACGRSITDFDLVWNSLNSVQKLLSLPNVAQFLIEDLGAVYA